MCNRIAWVAKLFAGEPVMLEELWHVGCNSTSEFWLAVPLAAAFTVSGQA